MMVLKPIFIGLPAIYPLSPWERVRERAKPNNLKKTSSEKDGNTKTCITQTTKKKKHKKQLLPNTFQTACSHQNRAHVV